MIAPSEFARQERVQFLSSFSIIPTRAEIADNAEIQIKRVQERVENKTIKAKILNFYERLDEFNLPPSKTLLSLDTYFFGHTMELANGTEVTIPKRNFESSQKAILEVMAEFGFDGTIRSKYSLNVFDEIREFTHFKSQHPKMEIIREVRKKGGKVTSIDWTVSRVKDKVERVKGNEQVGNTSCSFA